MAFRAAHHFTGLAGFSRLAHQPTSLATPGAAFRSALLARTPAGSPAFSRTVAPLAVSRALALHTSSSTHNTLEATPKTKRALPDVVPQHEPNRMHGSYHWDFERALSVALVPLVGAQVAYGAHPITDLLMGVVLPLHCHIGWDSMVTDYVHPRKYPRLGPLCAWSLRLFTVLTLVGCFSFNTNDIGLTELVKRTWKA
ncbi:membrane anchor subunit of succinate dehydrogenase, Sdh4 [Tieghemiomyces parasiticus]|uniref:Succinate dehydrogenase [ubiquinone] cytochrome b small subunit n=1 Tax=Tieghemiomyces parasiticus TaxID=78921 RepID=A0A9W8ABG9_9FUNG|nr:membrane anchor subunit of succinate dehydrogenase, Sdh4 [Tieghemiomyces parasiticus]